MVDATTTDDPGVSGALASLKSILVRDEMLEAWAIQHRLFALHHRRVLIAATSNRMIALARRLIGGYDYTDVRWQDLKEVHLSVGILGATLRLVAENSSDLATAEGTMRHLSYNGLVAGQAQAVYRICQMHDQAWREKRRIREIEELRARSGGVQIMGGSPSLATGGGDPVQQLERARQMLAAKLISDAEYETIKAKILSGP